MNKKAEDHSTEQRPQEIEHTKWEWVSFNELILQLRLLRSCIITYVYTAVTLDL
jgi:hypothetical protein